jgi:aminopeptidase N
MLFIAFQQSAFSQPFKHAQKFTRYDTLRGSLGPGRTWWDVLKYDIYFTPNPVDSTISGCNYITYKVVGPQNFMQIDLQKPLFVDSAAFINSKGQRQQIHLITAKRDSNCLFFYKLPEQTLNSINTFVVYYHGRSRIARLPPWDGGLIWRKDSKGNPWISIACQSLGASVWYPCKDHQSDEPDSAALHITCADTLVGVGNGRLKGKTQNPDKTTTWHWAVSSPINSYCIIPYIGKYVHFGEVYQGENGPLDMDYWVLEENLEKAKKQFADAPKMMKAFEHWFGPYPFYKDSYKLVDAPYLGMEHQSATAYGNGYLNGYYGRDLSGSGWGMKWDFIIVHESGHEWFANNITTKDIADMWVHEGFTNYSETLFTDYYFGKQAGNEYCRGLRHSIANDKPIIGPYGVNQEGSGDMYYKAANMIHIIRQLIDDDEKFRMILRGLNKDFWHQTVTTQQVEEYISKQAGKDFTMIFNQYLRTAKIPILQYKIKKGILTFRWTNCIEGFNMPVKVMLEKDKYALIYPTTAPQKIKIALTAEEFKVDPNFYVFCEKLK